LPRGAGVPASCGDCAGKAIWSFVVLVLMVLRLSLCRCGPTVGGQEHRLLPSAYGMNVDSNTS
jgi:hypothetical protein